MTPCLECICRAIPPYKPMATLAVLVAMFWAGIGAAQSSTVTAFVGVDVIPMDSERVLTNQTVLVRGSQIAGLGPAAQVPIPAGARRIDGHGKFLIPGLSDMHSHVNAQDLAGLFVYLANGVTTVHYETMGPAAEYRQLTAGGASIPPRSFGTGDFPECKPGPGAADTSVADCVARIKAARLAAGEPVPDDSSMHAIARRAGLGYENHTPETLEEFQQALHFRWKYFDHLLTYQDYVIGHQLPFWYSLEASGAQSERLDTAAWMRPEYRLDPQRLRDIAEATRRAGTWNIMTLVVKDLVAVGREEEYPGYRRVSQRRLDFDRQIVKALSDAGAGLLLGADRFDFTSGFAVHREMELLIEAGLTPYQVLEIGTRNAAIFTGTQDSAGTVAVGKLADLVLLDGNPLKDVRNATWPAGVMFNGRWLPRSDIEARSSELEANGCSLLTDLRRAASQHRGITRELLMARADDTCTAS